MHDGETSVQNDGGLRPWWNDQTTTSGPRTHPSTNENEEYPCPLQLEEMDFHHSFDSCSVCSQESKVISKTMVSYRAKMSNS